MKKQKAKWLKHYELYLNESSKLVIYEEEHNGKKAYTLKLISQITDTVHGSFLIDRYHNVQAAKIGAQRYVKRMARNIE